MSDSIHIICPHCDGVNRVPIHRNAADGKCGKCHSRLFEKHPVPLDPSRFDKHIGRSDIPVVVDFWAPWCGPCRMMAPEFEKAAAALEPRVRLVKVNTEEAAVLAARFHIQSIPTLIIFKQGREITRTSGALSAQQLISWVAPHA